MTSETSLATVPCTGRPVLPPLRAQRIDRKGDTREVSAEMRDL
jgi:hypothetical protein